MKCRYRVLLVLIGAGVCLVIMGEEVTSWFLHTSPTADLKGTQPPITNKLKLTSPLSVVAPTLSPPHSSRIVYGDSKGSLMNEKVNVMREEDTGPWVTSPRAAVPLRTSVTTRHRMVLAVVCCGNRVNETMTMLKSAVALSHSPLKMIVFTEEDLKPVFKNMYTTWPADARERIKLDLHSINFPTGKDAAEWRKLFKPCSSQRLFMPSLLVDIDALLYVDTDVVFLAPLEELWRHFQAMNSSHLAAMAPEHEDLATGWYNRFAKHPYYGRLGVNSGVMLMNLTRLRQFGWEEYVVPVYNHFKSAITWGDQDIINIIFHYHPDKLYVYGCEYNFRPDHCMYMSVCKTAEKHGIFVLHGSRSTFHKNRHTAFKAVYRAWEEYKLGQDLRQDLYYPMQRYLLKTSQTKCGKMHSTFLKAMGSVVKLR